MSVRKLFSALLRLPTEPYVYAEWRRFRAGIDYHAEVYGHWYSVPSRLMREAIEARITDRPWNCSTAVPGSPATSAAPSEGGTLRSPSTCRARPAPAGRRRAAVAGLRQGRPVMTIFASTSRSSVLIDSRVSSATHGGSGTVGVSVKGLSFKPFPHLEPYRSRTSAERFARRQPARIGSSRSSP